MIVTVKSENNFKVQVIVPVYNAEDTLNKCLDSLIAQTYQNWEAILIDDHSPDKSSEIMQAYFEKDSRFQIMRNEKNVGVSCTRNRALDMVDADYIMFLDSDDMLEDCTIECMMNEAKRGFDVVQCAFLYDFENGKSMIPSAAFEKDTELFGEKVSKVYLKMAVGINMNHVCMKLIKSELIANMRFAEKLKTGEDLAFCATLFEKVNSYKFIKQPFYRYFRNSGSLTSGGISMKEKWKANKRAAEFIKSGMKNRNIKNPLYYILADLRIYIITVSKIFRSIREKIIIIH